jgi:hypothetical protein
MVEIDIAIEGWMIVVEMFRFELFWILILTFVAISDFISRSIIRARTICVEESLSL